MKLLNSALLLIPAFITLSSFGAAGPALPTPGTVFIMHDETLLKNPHTYIIGCDAGRFEVRVGIFAIDCNRPKLVLEYRTPADDIIPFSEDLALRFALYIKAVLAHLTQHYQICITQACFGAAGPTTANRDYIGAPHAPFAVSGAEIRKQTSIQKTLVINDFEIVGLGMEAIDKSQITTLLTGTPRARGTKLIIGAGNGLGSGLMLWNDKLESYMPSPLNYSFVDFSPQSELELRYNDYLKRTSNNAWGKVLGSSAGIVDIYTFLNEPKTALYQHANYQEIFDRRDTDAACKNAVDFYMKQYIRLMRNAAYTQAPYGGLYITNAVAEKNPALFTDASFKTEFLNTGDLANSGNKYLFDYLQQIPVYLVTSPDLKLYGAAQYALVHLKD